MDLIIAFSACPMDLLPINGLAGKPTEAHFQSRRSEQAFKPSQLSRDCPRGRRKSGVCSAEGLLPTQPGHLRLRPAVPKANVCICAPPTAVQSPSSLVITEASSSGLTGARPQKDAIRLPHETAGGRLSL